MAKPGAARSNVGRGDAKDERLYLVTPVPAMEALREATAGVDLMERHRLRRYDSETTRTLRKGFTHFLSPLLQAVVKEKPRVMLTEKAEFAELLSEEPSGRPIQELSMELLRRSFMIRRKVVIAGGAEAEEGEKGTVPDVPMVEQTTNKFSPAYSKKVWVCVSCVGICCTVVSTATTDCRSFERCNQYRQ